MPSTDSKFDQSWYGSVCEQVRTSVHDIHSDSTATVLPHIVKQAIEESPLGKAGGYDKIQYGHLIFAKDVLSPILANVFTCMMRSGYASDKLKRGDMVILHKEGNKRKDQPDNYRAITLTSVLLKQHESVIFSRSKPEMISSISQEQGGFQDGMSCLMTSFVLRESIQCVREFKYTCYACFNDDRKAFNVVWYESLMHKRLSESGIDNRTVLAFYLHQHDFTDSLGTIYQWSNLTNRERWPRNVYVIYVCWLPDRRR